MPSDLTVVFYAANRTQEHFGEMVRAQLLRSIGDLPLISISQQPMDFGKNICVGDIGQTHLNIYRQMLWGAQAADTKWIAYSEDDILYPPDHFKYRPSRDDVAAYDQNKWSIYTWTRPPMFSLKLGRHTSGCIVSRDVAVSALEERFAKYPDDNKVPLEYWAELGRYENHLGVTPVPIEDFYSGNPTVIFSHPEAYGYRYMGTTKRMGMIRAIEIPYWGRADDLLRDYYGL